MTRIAYFWRTFLCAILGHRVLRGAASSNVSFRAGGQRPVPSFVCMRCRGAFALARAQLR